MTIGPFAERLMQESPGIDVLVTNAGINVHTPDTTGAPSAIVNVASQAAAMITGDTLATDGGDMIRWSAQPTGSRCT